ncbi:MAG: helix-turn-helix domain containing protein [Paracoccaceae bacterium]|nr:helix-turn-helix domain containing protein [Paracoccaceae bacterium]MDE2675859.1 helix-turn-helix domain containing protein [Paracoccaceae bacterium]MYF45737.1 TetR/AcrR family transcriptional regulator [Paracoccaceae bacterium]
MNERNVKIVETAVRLFAQYSVAKTSMAEIAAEAGVARQTVYNSFENKEDLIFAALLHYAGSTKNNIEQDCKGFTELGPRLDVLFKHMAVVPFEAMQKFPHLDEIMIIADNLSEERKAMIKNTYKDAIRHVLLPFESRIRNFKIEPESLYDLMKAMLTQIKREAKDEENLRQLFEPIRLLLINLLNNSIQNESFHEN